MKSKFGLKILNIFVIISISLLCSYWSITLYKSSDLETNDKDIISIIIATVIVVTGIIISGLLSYSTFSLYKGIYKNQTQKTASILLTAFALVSDLFVFRFFLELSIVSKILFVFFNVVTLFHLLNSFKKVPE